MDENSLEIITHGFNTMATGFNTMVTGFNTMGYDMAIIQQTMVKILYLILFAVMFQVVYAVVTSTKLFKSVRIFLVLLAIAGGFWFATTVVLLVQPAVK